MATKALLTVLTPIPWAGLGRAGDAAQLRPLGFCADGRCYAFAQVGVLDGSGLSDAAGAVAAPASIKIPATWACRVRSQAILA